MRRATNTHKVSYQSSRNCHFRDIINHMFRALVSCWRQHNVIRFILAANCGKITSEGSQREIDVGRNIALVFHAYMRLWRLARQARDLLTARQYDELIKCYSPCSLASSSTRLCSDPIRGRNSSSSHTSKKGLFSRIPRCLQGAYCSDPSKGGAAMWHSKAMQGFLISVEPPKVSIQITLFADSSVRNHVHVDEITTESAAPIRGLTCSSLACSYMRT